MRQFRPTITISFITPKIKKETDRAFLFEFEDGYSQWIPKKWIKRFSKNKKSMSVKEYWMNEMVSLGFEKVKKI
jgi:hypothetical protein